MVWQSKNGVLGLKSCSLAKLRKDVCRRPHVLGGRLLCSLILTRQDWFQSQPNDIIILSQQFF